MSFVSKVNFTIENTKTGEILEFPGITGIEATHIESALIFCGAFDNSDIDTRFEHK